MRLQGRASGDPRTGTPKHLPPPPPECPPGWHTGPPDFVGVGVQRCGTTRWYDLIAAHPEVTGSPAAKELHFFDDLHSGAPDPEWLGRYDSYFPRAPGQLAGEWTPMYMAAPWIIPLLARVAPQARLLVLLRDPVERYLSGLQLGNRVAQRRGERVSRLAPLDAFARGLYHSQLTQLLRHFDRSQVLVQQYERCTADPRGELGRTLAFIGVEQTSFTADLEHHPERQSEKPALDASTRAAYTEAYRDDVARLVAEFPEIDIELWPNFAGLKPA
jgi:hypothetical protein